MSTFMSGAADCGPSNALKDVSARLDVDRGWQRVCSTLPSRQDALTKQERFTANTSVTRSLPPAVGQQVPRVAQPFDLSTLRQHLEPSPAAGPSTQYRPPPLLLPQQGLPFVAPQSFWPLAYNVGAVPTPASKGKGRASWADDFQAQAQAPMSAGTAQRRAHMQSAPPSAFMPDLHAHAQYRPMPFLPQQPHWFGDEHARQHGALTSTWAPTYDVPPPVHAQQFAGKVTQNAQPLTESQDILAHTARDLVNGLDAEQTLANNPKLAQSQFVSLLRDLGAGETVVQEPQDAIPAAETVGEGAKFVARADWVGDFLGQMGRASPASTSGLGQSHAAMAEQDAILMTDRPAKSVHFDASPALGRGVPRSLDEALASATAVPGASLAWEDSALDDFDTDALLAYNGEMRTAQPSSTAIAESARWDEMRQDWERWTASQVPAVAGMGTGEQAEHYLFQARNPYSPESLAREASPTVQLTCQGVLELEAAVQQAPRDAGAWLALGLKQQENEREGAAILALSKSVQLDPDSADAHLALAVSYTNEGEKEAANTVLARWIELKAGTLVGGGQTTAGSSSREQLIARLVDMARARPDDVDADVQVALGVLFNASEEWSKAEDCFLAALSVRPDDWLLYNRLGATLANGGRPGDAIAFYNRALALHPNFVRALFNLGIAHANLGEHARAAQCVLDALRLQHADASEGYAAGQHAGVKGVLSDSLWNTLRSACLQHDLVQLASQHELQGFPLEIATA